MLILTLVACFTAPPPEPEPAPELAPELAPPATSPTEPVPSTEAPSSTHRGPPAAGRLVVPGERVGEITAATTRADLDRILGPGLEDIEATVGEGETRPGTRWREGQPEELTVVWLTSERDHATEVRGLGPAWRTAEGLGVGSTLGDLDAALGPFQVYGFGWDYGGTLSLEGSRLAAMQGLLWLRLQPVGSLDEPDYARLLGDRLFPSTDPHLRGLAPTVGWMGVALERQAE